MDATFGCYCYFLLSSDRLVNLTKFDSDVKLYLLKVFIICFKS